MLLCLGEDVTLPKEQMKELQEVLTSSFFKSVKDVRTIKSVHFVDYIVLFFPG